jgi:hypothetical protein
MIDLLDSGTAHCGTNSRWLAIFLTAFCTLWPAADVLAKDPPGHRTIRVLYVGNSYTFGNDMPGMVTTMSKMFPGTVQIESKSVARGGATLEDHWATGDVEGELRERKWNFVVLQERSRRPLDDPKRMLHFGRLLGQAIRSSGARTVLFLTWPRQSRPEDMNALEAGYRALARDLNATIAPVGPAWLAAIRRTPSIALYQEDGSHPTHLGSYLTACVIYLTLQDDQRACPDLPNNSFPTETVSLVKQEAANAVNGERSRSLAKAVGRSQGR